MQAPITHRYLIANKFIVSITPPHPTSIQLAKSSFEKAAQNNDQCAALEAVGHLMRFCIRAVEVTETGEFLKLDLIDNTYLTPASMTQILQLDRLSFNLIATLLTGLAIDNGVETLGEMFNGIVKLGPVASVSAH